eukprot:4342704-Amphidinium_carterae.1
MCGAFKLNINTGKINNCQEASDCLATIGDALLPAIQHFKPFLQKHSITTDHVVMKASEARQCIEYPGMFHAKRLVTADCARCH